MKIAMIFFSLNVPGGSASVFLSLANELKDTGYDVDIYSYYFDKKRCFPDLTRNLSITSVKNIQSSSIQNSVFVKLREGVHHYISARKIFSLMKVKKYDVIFTSEASAYIPGLIYKSKFNTPVIWSVFDPLSLVDRDRPGMLVNKYKWFEYLLKIHNYFDTKNIRRIDSILVPTAKMKSQLDRFYGIKVKVFPLAGIRQGEINRSHENLIRKRLKNKFSFTQKNEFILFSHGHFLEHRRYEDSLYAVKELVKKNIPLKFIISGSDKFDSAYFNTIKNLVHNLDLDKYVILDTEFKTTDEVLGYYQICNIFLFVSVEQTWGLAPFEAMACQKPVILSRGVGCHEVFTDRFNAIIVDERSPRQIAEAIELLAQDKKLYNKIAKAGKEITINNFTYKIIAKRLVSYLETFI